MAELTEMQMNVHLGSRAWAEVMLDTGRRTQGVGASATELELAGVGVGVQMQCWEDWPLLSLWKRGRRLVQRGGW